jgi:hypothetical protein
MKSAETASRTEGKNFKIHNIKGNPLTHASEALKAGK